MRLGRFAERPDVKPAPFGYHRAASVAEAVSLLSAYEGSARVIAGGQSLMPMLNMRLLRPDALVDVNGVRELAGVRPRGFGLKLGIYPEDLLACLHARSLRRPVRFVEDRNEHFRATTHGRESVHEYRIAARSDGRILAMSDAYTNDLGGLNSPFGSSQLSTVVFNGPYKVIDGFVERRVVVTNKTPIGAYRGYGSPRSTLPVNDSSTSWPGA